MKEVELKKTKEFKTKHNNVEAKSNDPNLEYEKKVLTVETARYKAETALLERELSEMLGIDQSVYKKEIDVLKSQGDAYELHIGRKFELKGDLVIYNGMIYGYQDQGVDLIIISKNDQSINLVQCKHWNKYELTKQHIANIYHNLSNYYRDYIELKPEIIKQYLTVNFSDDDIRQRIKESQHYPIRKTLYLATDHVMTSEVRTLLTHKAGNIYRYQDMKVVVSGIR